MPGLVNILSDEDIAAALARAPDQPQDGSEPESVTPEAQADAATQPGPEPLLDGFGLVNDLGADGLA